MDWIFEGIGTLVVGLLLGAGGGGLVGYRYGVGRQIQKQKAGNNSNQYMTGGDNITGRDDRR